MSQIALPLAWPADPQADDYLIGPSNAQAATMLEHWGAWPVMATLLVGPRKSGRSLLARIFAAKSGGRIVDDAERMAEAQVFHAWNAAQSERRPLLIVAMRPRRHGRWHYPTCARALPRRRWRGSSRPTTR